MGAFFAILLLCFSVWLIVSAIKQRKKKVNTTNVKQPVPQQPPQIVREPKIDDIVTNFTISLGDLDSLRDKGPLTPSGSNAWIINPKAKNKITIYGTTLEAAQELKQCLDGDSNWYQLEDKITPIISKYNIRCKELDEFVAKAKKHVEEFTKAKLASHPEYVSATDLDKRDIEEEVKAEAYSLLMLEPYGDLEDLINGSTLDRTQDDVLYQRYGVELANHYLEYANSVDSVYTAPSDSYHRKKFELMAEHGLAIRGTAIKPQTILNSLTLKQMNEVAAGIAPKPFARKAKAIEALESLPDLQDRLTKVISFRELFQVQALPQEFAGLNLENLSLVKRYDRALAKSIIYGYSTDELFTKVGSRPFA